MIFKAWSCWDELAESETRDEVAREHKCHCGPIQ